MPTTNKHYINIADILRSKWLMEFNSAHAYFPLVFEMLSGRMLSNSDNSRSANAPKTKEDDYFSGKVYNSRVLSLIDGDQSKKSNVYHISEYGLQNDPESAPVNSIAVIDLIGPITKYDQFCGNAGTLTKANLLQRALDNPNIIGVILNQDSGGGQGDAPEVITSIIKNSSKPVVAYVTGMSASASYWISSACEYIVIDGKTSEVGSIGVYIQIADFTKYYADKGIDIITQYAPQSTLKNKAYEDLLKGNNEAMKTSLEEFTNFFIDTVKENRAGKLSDNADIFKGEMFYAENAVSQGLADKFGSLADAIIYIQQHSSNDNSGANNNYINMTKIAIAAGQKSVLAALNLTVEENTENIEVELTEEQATTLVNDLETAHQTIATEQQRATDLQSSIDDLQSQLDAMTEQYNTLKGTDAVETTAPEKKKDANNEEKYLTDIDRQARELAEANA